MPNPGNLGSIVPQDDPGALWRRVADLERLIQQMATARTLEAATIGRGGITVTNNGAVTVTDSDGHTVAIIGALPTAYNRSDGSRQPGLALYREDGSLAAILGDVNPTTPPYKQAFQIYDRNGDIVVADDTNSGYGIALPNLSYSAMTDSNYATWPATNAGSFTTIAYCWYQAQAPRVQFSLDYTGDVGVAGQFRMMVSWPGNTHGLGTAQVGTTQTQGTSGSFGFWSFYGNLPYALSSVFAGGTGSAYLYFELQAQVTSGTGKMYAACSQFGGGQS